MYYKIKKNDIENLFSIEKLQLKVNKLIINKYVNEGNVLPKDTDDFKTQQEKYVAYLIINHDEIFLHMREDKTIENETHLLAALMTDAKEVVIKIPDSKTAEELKSKYQLEAVVFREPNINIINEEFLLGLTEDGWDNREFILKKLNTFNLGYSNEENNKKLTVELISYIPEEQWHNNDFLEIFFKHPHINHIFHYAIEKEKIKTFDILLNDKILEIAINLNIKELVLHYVKTYSDYDRKDNYGSYSLKKDRNNDVSKDLIEKEKIFSPSIGKYFKDIDYATKMIQIIPSDYFELFDLQLRKDEGFKEQYIVLALKYLEQKASSHDAYIGNFTNLVGVDVFSDERIQKFALEHGHKSYDQSYKPLLAVEVMKGDNAGIAKIISKATGVDFLWDYFSVEQKQSKELVSEILKQNPKIYNKLNESLKLDKDIFKIYYNELKKRDSVKDFKVGKINKSFFESFNEDEIIDLIKVVPHFLLEEKFPAIYFKNMKVMAHTNFDYSVFNELQTNNEQYKETIQKVFDNKELSMLMLEQHCNIFPLFSEKVRSDMEVLEKYVKKSYDYDNLPPKVFFNKKILLHILAAKPSFVDKIPQQYLKDQDFLLRIFSKVDNKELNEQILTSLPTVINEVLNTNPLKVGEYYEFFSKTFTNMNLTQKLEPGKKDKTKANKI